MEKNAAPSDKKASATSKSEQIFDWLTYGGVAAVGGFILTIPVAYIAKHGWGAKYFASISKAVSKIGLSEKTAEQAVMTTALMQGGNIALLPVKWAEDNKIACIETIDNFTGDKTDVEALKKEDKQTWGSIIKARLVAWGVVFSSLTAAVHVLGEKKIADFENGFAKNIVCKPLGKPTHIGGKESFHFKVGKISALDVFATAAATALFYVGSRFFAHVNKNKAAPEMLEEKPVTPTIQEDSPSYSSPALASKFRRPADTFVQTIANRGEAASLGLSA